MIEDLAKCNYRASFETLGSSNGLKGNGVIKLNRMTAIEVKLDALMNKLGNNERRMHSTHEVGTVDESEKRNSVEEGLAHEGPYQVEEAQYLNANISYKFKPNLNLPTHYTPALRNHDNFSYGGGAQQGQRHRQNFQHQQEQGSQRAENQGQRRSLSFEDQMMAFIGENKRQLNIHEHKFSNLAAFQANTTVFQANTNASLKNLETQVGQLALAMQNQSKDAFLIDTNKNSKDYMVMTLRSGGEIESGKEEEKKKTEKVEVEETGKENKLSSSDLAEETEKEKVQTEQREEKVAMKKNEEKQAYMPAIPFHQRLQKAKMEEQFSRFLDVFKKIEINLPFAEALT